MTTTVDAMELVAARQLVTDAPVVRFRLAPGDHALVEKGQAIEPGQPLLEHVRDARVEDVLARPGGAPPAAPGGGEGGAPEARPRAERAPCGAPPQRRHRDDER